MKKALEELKRTGDYTGMTQDEWITARKQVEDIIGLEELLSHRAGNGGEDVRPREG